ncbi:MAG TPA: hypothetical protein VF278_00770 [Pirellulales bacterium]
MRYGNGEITLAVTDLSALGFGLDFTHTRIFSNRLADDTDFGNGYNWLIRDLPHLVEIGADTVMVVRGTRSTNWFDLINGVYVARFGAALLPLPSGEGRGEGGLQRYPGDEAIEHRSPHAPRGETHHAERGAYGGFTAGVLPTYYLPTYAQALGISGATIVEQTETLYDAASNSIQTTFRQRFHNASRLGPLTEPVFLSTNINLRGSLHQAVRPQTYSRLSHTGEVRLV